MTSLFQAEAIERLERELPPFDSAASPEDQARATLRVLLDAVRVAPRFDPSPYDPRVCPNCGTPCSSLRSPYCSERCREVSSFVRQFRAGLAESTIFDPERQVAIGQNLWHILGGGRPLRRSLISPKEIEKVIAKAGGRCAACGAEAVTVDHLKTGCNRPNNLRAVCKACCRTREFMDDHVLQSGAETLAELAKRIGAVHPIRVCDAAATWDWREFVARRKRENLSPSSKKG